MTENNTMFYPNFKLCLTISMRFQYTISMIKVQNTMYSQQDEFRSENAIFNVPETTLLLC